MWLFSRKAPHKKRGLVAVFDIGSLSVGGALVELTRHDGEEVVPTILWSHRELLPFQKELNVDRLVKELYRALTRVGEAMLKKGLGRPNRAYILLASPWHASQTRIASFTQKRESIVSEWLVETLIDREVEAFLKSGAASYGASSEQSVVVIEEKGMQLLLNGFAVEHPFGKRAKEVEVALYVSMSPGSFLKELTARVDQIFPSIDIDFHTFAFVAYSTIRDLFAEERTFLICDVSGEVTDVSLVRDDVLIETTSFSYGKNNVVRAVVKASDTSPEEALSRIALASLSGKDARFRAPVKKALGAARTEWKQLLSKALSGLVREGALPRSVFLTASAGTTAWFSDSFEEISGEGLPQFSITEVSASFLRPFTGVSEAKKDPFLLLEALFLAKVEKETNSVVE